MDDLLVSIKAFIFNNYNGISNYTQGFLRPAKVGCPIDAVWAARDINVPDTNLGIRCVEHVVLVALTPHPACNNGSGIAIPCSDVLRGGTITITGSGNSSGKGGAVTPRVAKKSTASHVLAVTSGGITQLALAAQRCDTNLCSFLINQDYHLGFISGILVWVTCHRRRCRRRLRGQHRRNGGSISGRPRIGRGRKYGIGSGHCR